MGRHTRTLFVDPLHFMGNNRAELPSKFVSEKGRIRGALCGQLQEAKHTRRTNVHNHSFEL